MLFNGLRSSKADENRSETVVCVNRGRRVVDNSFNEFVNFVCISHHVAFEEEEHRFLSDDAVFAAVNCIGVGVVGDGNAAFVAEDFSALIVTVASCTAVVDDSRSAVVEFQRDDSRVDVACFTDSRVNRYGTFSVNFFNFCAGEIADHIEIMDRHVEEDTAGYFNVCNGRRLRVTGRDFDDLLFADFACCNGIMNSFEVVVEAAVEANLVFEARLFDDVENFFDLVDVMVDRFLAEYVFAGFQSFDGERGMLVRRSADQNSADLRIVQDFMVIFRRLFDAERLSPSFRLFVHERNGDRFYRSVFDEFGDAFAMNMTDTTCANDTNFNHSYSAFRFYQLDHLLFYWSLLINFSFIIPLSVPFCLHFFGKVF